MNNTPKKANLTLMSITHRIQTMAILPEHYKRNSAAYFDRIAAAYDSGIIEEPEYSHEPLMQRLPEAQLTVGSSEQLPYPEIFFDTIICVHSFHHYPYPMRSLKEMQRVCRHGGALWLVENRKSFAERTVSFIKYRIYDQGDVCLYSTSRLVKMAKRAGFDDVDAYMLTDKSYLITARKY